jgi:diadenosine tetraphosphatase ApaH/serine/threonine PP2A family protein phosphatase
MRIAVISDVHANLAALRSVLDDAERRRALDGVWALGDFVGYGPQPNEVLDLLRSFTISVVSGNHDLAALGAIDTDDFNPAAAVACQWSADHLSEDSREFLSGLPPIVADDETHSVRCHGSLRAPAWEYVISQEAARAQFDLMDVPLSFVGHTHIPLVIEEGTDGEIRARHPRHGQSVALGKERLILNPGGVGQPRDGDPQASYAIVDTAVRSVEFRRVAYPIRQTQALMEAAGLPETLIRRLERGT